MYDLIIIGGGAGGLACAVTASKRGKKVIILESEDKLGKKILVSGNGKCNLSNTEMSVEYYNTPVINEIIKRNVASFFEELGLAVKNIEGRIYPYSESALSIVNILRNNINCDVICNLDVGEIIKRGDTFSCCGYEGKNVLLATGSNATKGKNSLFLYKKFGHKTYDFTPSIVPLRGDTIDIKGLSGLRAKCKLRLFFDEKMVSEKKGEILFKDNGISGIVSMMMSTEIARNTGKYKNCTISIDFVPEKSEEDITHFIKKNGAEAFLQKAIAQSVEKQAKRRKLPLEKVIKDFVIEGIRIGDMKNAQVACGGLDILEFDDNLQSKHVKGLYACGEALNVDGECGGYNLHFAFSSGILVGEKC